jgi:hypothetical protein
MSAGRTSARAALIAVGVGVSVLLMAAPSWAAGGTKLCIPTGENAPVKTPLSNGTCASTKTEKYTLTELGAEGKEGKQGPEGKEGKQGKEGKEGPEGKLPLSEEEEATLKGILPCIKSVAKGIDEKPTVQFHGCNVQIVNGEGHTDTTNGTGNLVIGYDKRRCANGLEGASSGEQETCELCGEKEGCKPLQLQTGSHNLILGAKQTFTSFGGIITGENDAITAPFASVTGGELNTASNRFATVSGGAGNKASGVDATVSGGGDSVASGNSAAVSGGLFNKATGYHASVTGGRANTANGEFSSIFGGQEQTAENSFEALP